MNAPDITSSQVVHAAQVASAMKASGLPDSFIAAALGLAQQQRGAYELLALWEEAESPRDRDEAVADLQELLEDAESRPSVPTKKPHIRFREVDGVVQRVLEHKKKLRDLIDRHGGVSRVAQLSGIPQPSLSRLLSSASMPRRTTLYKIAAALDVSETEIATEWDW